MNSGEPAWPDDILYLPVERGGKGPDTSQLGTWGYDGTGCTHHGDLTDRRWGIVDVDVPGWRLLIVDLDVHKMDTDRADRVEAAIDDLPPTRVHESQSGGLHVFYWLRADELTEAFCPRCEETFDSQRSLDEHTEETGHRGSSRKLPVILTDEVDDKLNGYVLSTHCEGYDVRRDDDPATISVEDLPDVWVKRDRVEPREGDGLTEAAGGRDDIDNLSVHDVINRASHPEGTRVAHPIHGSSTGTNFMVDPGADTWRCWRHDTTGNALHLVGMDAGIISCGDWPLDTSTWADILQEAEDRGLIEPSRPDLDEAEVAEHAHVIDRRRAYPGIDDVDTLPERSFVLDKPPREGGSYRIMKEFTSTDIRFMTVAPRHSILEYHVETLADLTDDTWCIVHFKGRSRVCDHADSECPAWPDESDRGKIQGYINEIRNTCHRKQIVTPEDRPTGVCKYWFLQQAAAHADVVLTVPQLARRVTDAGFHPDKLFIDEEQALAHFRPGSVDLCTVRTSVDTDENASVEAGATDIRKQLGALEDILERIDADQEERAESNDSGDFRETPEERDIKAAIETAGDLARALSVKRAKAAIRSRGDGLSMQSVLDELRDRLDGVEFPETDADPDRLKDKIIEYAAPYFWDESVEPAKTLEAVLFPYTENRFHFKTIQGETTIRLVGDGERVFYKDWFGAFGQVAAIAGPEGERFLDTVAEDPCVLDITEFKYADRFIVLPIAKQDGDGFESKAEQVTRAERLSERLNRHEHPHIAVTGTKNQAYSHHRRLTAGSDVITDPPSPAVELYKRWAVGDTAIIYENSVVSRGIDAPFFDVSVVVDTGFASPYWEARADHYDRGTDEHTEAVAIKQELTERELTNAVLRMSPTYSVDGAYGTKIIAVPKATVRRLKYLGDDRTAPRVAYADTAAQIIELLTVGGAFMETLEDVYDGVGRSEKDFIQIATVEEFSEIKTTRPSYTIDDVSGWVENSYLNGDVVNEVIGAIGEVGEEPTTSNIKSEVDNLSGGKVSAILNVLESKGVVLSSKGDTDGRGRPPTVWELSKNFQEVL